MPCCHKVAFVKRKIVVDRFIDFCDIWFVVKIVNNLNAAPSGLILTRLAVLTDTVGGGIEIGKNKT